MTKITSIQTNKLLNQWVSIIYDNDVKSLEAVIEL